jgi:hypothetical protein
VRISEVVADGTTLLFVSHDLAAVEATCERAMWLTDAMVRAAGPARGVLAEYRAAIEAQAATASDTESALEVRKFSVTGPDGGIPRSGEDAEARIVLNAPEGAYARFYLGVSQGTAMPIFVVRNRLEFPTGEFELRCVMKNIPLPKGRYYLWLAVLGTFDMAAKQVWKPVGHFDVFGPGVIDGPKGVVLLSPVFVDATFEMV